MPLRILHVTPAHLLLVSVVRKLEPLRLSPLVPHSHLFVLASHFEHDQPITIVECSMSLINVLVFILFLY